MVYDRISHIGTKDASIELGGVFIIEIGELDAFLRAKVTTQNSFITRRSERFRPPWAKYPLNFPRQCIFAATINPPANGCYLRDPTGARRFWPITCIGRIDLDGFRAVCDQLWAEAAHLYKSGHRWHLETPELEALATAEQAARFARDPWEPTVRDWL